MRKEWNKYRETGELRIRQNILIESNNCKLVRADTRGTAVSHNSFKTSLHVIKVTLNRSAMHCTLHFIGHYVVPDILVSLYYYDFMYSINTYMFLLIGLILYWSYQISVKECVGMMKEWCIQCSHGSFSFSHTV